MGKFRQLQHEQVFDFIPKRVSILNRVGGVPSVYSL